MIAPAPVRTMSTLSGICQGTYNAPLCTFTGTVTVASAGAVDATATVSGFAGPMALVILGYNAGPATGGTCSTQFLTTPLSTSAVTTAPIITGHWDSVPVGTYCLNVAPVPVPEIIQPYTWTVTVTHP
jgi:hypothetical protein